MAANHRTNVLLNAIDVFEDHSGKCYNPIMANELTTLMMEIKKEATQAEGYADRINALEKMRDALDDQVKQLKALVLDSEQTTENSLRCMENANEDAQSLRAQLEAKPKPIAEMSEEERLAISKLLSDYADHLANKQYGQFAADLHGSAGIVGMQE